MNKAKSDQIIQFLGACEKVAKYSLSLCSSGNLSWRIGFDEMLIKGSRAWMSEMKSDNVARCRISDGKSLNDVKPSVEIGFHSGIFKVRSDVNVVLHFQTPFATALSCRKNKQKYAVLPEIPFYIKNIKYVPFYLPGSKRLADAVVDAMRKNEMVIMRNHGQVTVGKDFNDAIQKAVFFEMVCEVIVRNEGKNVYIPRGMLSKLTV